MHNLQYFFSFIRTSFCIFIAVSRSMFVYSNEMQIIGWYVFFDYILSLVSSCISRINTLTCIPFINRIDNSNEKYWNLKPTKNHIIDCCKFCRTVNQFSGDTNTISHTLFISRMQIIFCSFWSIYRDQICITKND